MRTPTRTTQHGRDQKGFTLLQLITTLAIISVVSALAVFGITSARAAIRLQNSVRQFAAYVERARADALRRHNTASVQLVDTSNYSVTMDFEVSGTATTQTFSLESGVTFITTLRTISFDWRGRTPSEVSVGFSNGVTTGNVNITGSGDVTIDAEIFHDASIPNLNLNANVPGGLVPDPSPAANSTPTPSPSPSSSPTPSPSPTATPTSTPTPTPTGTPTP